MATVLRPRVTFSVPFTDNDNNTVVKDFNIPFPDVASLIQLPVYGDLMIDALAAISDARIDGYSARVNFDIDPPFNDGLNENSEVSRKAVFTFETVEKTTARFEIPSVRNSLVIDGTNTIDRNNLLIAAFTAIVLNGTFGPNNGIVTGAGLQLEELKRVFKAHRNSSDG